MSYARLAIAGPIGPREAPALCERAGRLVAEQAATLLVCDVRDVVGADFGTVGALARLALTTRRLGCSLQLHEPSADLCALLGFAGLAGLADIAGTSQGSGGQTIREAE